MKLGKFLAPQFGQSPFEIYVAGSFVVIGRYILRDNNVNTTCVPLRPLMNMRNSLHSLYKSFMSFSYISGPVYVRFTVCSGTRIGKILMDFPLTGSLS
jgi:hypothetical protein